MLVEAGVVAASEYPAIVGIVRQALRTSDGAESWCNLTLEVDEEHPAAKPDSVLFSIVAARGPASPLATVMGATVRRKRSPAQIGLQHKAGQKAALQLLEAEIELPSSWNWVQDHPRRGLVISLPDGDIASELVDWLIPAMELLNRAPVTARLVYELHQTS